MQWFPAEGGSGLDRMYHGLVQHLPAVHVAADGLVTGTAGRLPGTASVSPFAAATDPLPRRLLALRRAARRHVETQRYDLVAVHFALYGLPLLGLVDDDRPLVLHFHGPWASESDAESENALKVRLKKAVEQIVYRRAHRFIVLSSAFRDILHQSYGVPMDRITIVPGGVDVDCFAGSYAPEEARERLGWPTDRPILLTVRRLVQRVGLEALVDAMQHVRDDVPDALLLMAGKGPLAPALSAQIDAAGLQDHVRLLGFVPDDDLPLAYRAADLSVMPTRALEGFGLSAIESLAAGTPVLVTPVGGLPDVVRDLSPALIFDGTSVAAMADRIAAALQDTLPLPSAMACRTFARTHYDWPIIAEQVRDVYMHTLASNT